MSELLLWHGWGMPPAAWDGLTAALEGRCQLRAQALPGYAGSKAPKPYTLENLVDALLEPVTTPVTLCGWSLGAQLAMLAAVRHPAKVERLILIGATPSFVQRPNWPHGMTPPALAEFAAAVASEPQAALKRFIALFNQNDVNARLIGRELGRVLGNSVASAALPSAAVLDAGLALLGDTDLRPLAPSISQPTLLIHGAHDPLMPLAAAQWLAATLPQAQLAIMADAAHAPFLSDTARCAALIADFVHA
jgi:pimeloyl-[acyl-carrier protein] methyl ester esterase